MAGEVGGMMQDAMRLKSAQVAKERALFSARAQSLQHSLFHPEQFQDTVTCRQQALETRMADCSALKEMGNEYFKQKRYQDAINMYERALGCLVYVVSERPDWRQNMRDSDLAVVDDIHNTCTSLTGVERSRESLKVPQFEEPSDSIALQAQQLLAALYGNLSTCSGALGDIGRAHTEASEGLKRAPNHPKLLLKRAQITMKPSGAGTTELKLALADLNAAVSDLKSSSNQYRVPDAVVASIHKHYRLFADQATQQMKKDKAQFSGMFGRGSVVDETHEETLRSEAADVDRQRGLSDTVRQQLAAMRKTLAMLEAEGKMAQARELAEHIHRVQQQLASGSLAAPEVSGAAEVDDVELDFENPSDDMKRLAEQMGIDLSRPDVLNELNTLNGQQKRRMGAVPDGKAAGAGGSSDGESQMGSTHTAGSSGGSDDVSVDELAEHIGVMPLPELVEFLGKQDLMSTVEAESMGEAEVRAKAIRMLRSSENPEAAEKGTRALMTRYIVFGLVFAFALYRLHSMGILQWLFTGDSPAWQRMRNAASSAAASAAPAFAGTADAGAAEWDGDFVQAEVGADGNVN